jgi:protein TonB
MTTNSVAMYRPNSNWQIVAAFTAAATIHLSALAIASLHHEAPAISPEERFADIDVYPNIDPPATPQIEIPVPPPPPIEPTDFVEPRNPPRLIQKPQAFVPIRPPGQTPLAGSRNPRASALSAPRPEYPYEARSRHIMGSGVANLTVDPTSGLVVGATMEKSTGSQILDNATLSAFRRWRFKPGTPSMVRIPITYNLTGASY